MLASAFKKLSSIHVLVVGDFMLDHYTIGKIERISPEAPVPIMQISGESCRPGGAGNVALNLAALGAQVSLLGMIGHDDYGQKLVDSIDTSQINRETLFQEDSLSTIVKKRLIAGSQQLMRLDYEKIEVLSEKQEQIVIDSLTQKTNVDVVAISDYNKGFLTPNILKAVIHWASQNSIPVLVDPKGDDFSKYRGATLIKPNLKEAYLASKLGKDSSIDDVAEALINQAQLKSLVITRSEKGISLFNKGEIRADFPVVAQEVMDVTGAGDTVLAVLCFAVGNGLNLSEAIELANMASGLAIGRLGCAHITLSEIAARLLEIRTDNKIFEESHLFPLIQALKTEEYVICVVEDSHSISLNMLHHLKELKKVHNNAYIVLYMDESDSSKEVASTLSSFNEVDFVILKKEGLSHLLATLYPKAVVFLKDDKLDKMVPIDQAINILASVN
ncbi:MAG: D-glycero-beta-D-manno-heptose-7-phosphate kinase [Rhabdochlamydiaceae bacterium]|nr:D-glycero-beta-D-manno-heptose-7-phosphate kinase [Candidatus Amphrikana amoebophyrae]